VPFTTRLAERRDAEAAWTMFRDPAQSGVVVVTLPEETAYKLARAIHYAEGPMAARLEQANQRIQQRAVAAVSIRRVQRGDSSLAIEHQR